MEERSSNQKIVLRCWKRRSRRLCAQQDSNESNASDCASIGDKWQPSPVSSPSPAEVNHGTLTPTVLSSVPTGDLNTAAGLSIPNKPSNPTSPLEAHTSGIRFFKVEEPTGEEPVNHLEDDQCLLLGQHKCEFCGMPFTRSDVLKRHVDYVHKSLPPYSCEICGKTFTEKCTLRRHINFHKTLRSYACEFCGKPFPNLGQLNRHLNAVHKTLRTHECALCGKAFARYDALKRHVDSVHRTLRPYPCEICGKNFSEMCYLKRHVDSLHKNLRKFPCVICDYSFKNIAALKRHVNTVHEKLRKFLCIICGHTFTQSGSLKHHLARLHPGQKREKPENPS